MPQITDAMGSETPSPRKIRVLPFTPVHRGPSDGEALPELLDEPRNVRQPTIFDKQRGEQVALRGLLELRHQRLGRRIRHASQRGNERSQAKLKLIQDMGFTAMKIDIDAAGDPARFDRVIAPERTEALWQALGRPRWLVVPTGHYQLVPYFWWAVGRGADHLDRVYGAPPH